MRDFRWNGSVSQQGGATTRALLTSLGTGECDSGCRDVHRPALLPSSRRKSLFLFQEKLCRGGLIKYGLGKRGVRLKVLRVEKGEEPQTTASYR